ncbi:hypothetical protein HYW39_02925 [Candidatus Curtissbacteria bacterium]|nr:hypothetical protein [Candidatus Curtissbacteria bacterium]
MLKPDFRAAKKEDYNLIGRIKVKVLVTVGLVAAALFMGQLIFANKLATDGQKLAEIEAEIRHLEQNNNILKTEIAKESSFVTISRKAYELGFGKPSKIITP